MKKVILVIASLIFGIGLSSAQDIYDDYFQETPEQSENFFYNEDSENEIHDELSDFEELEITPTSNNDKRDELVNILVRYILEANYKGVNHDGVYTMSAENVIIYSAELTQYEPFTTFQNQLVSTYYILNLASLKSGLEPVYSIAGETNPEYWPVEKMVGTITSSKTANGYRRTGTRGFSSPTDTITYHNEEEQRKFDEKVNEEKSSSGKKKIEMLDNYIDLVGATKFTFCYDTIKMNEFLISENLVEIYSKTFNNLVSRSFNTEATVKYVLNKASEAHGLEPVYSVNDEKNPDKWNIARYKYISESPKANGYRMAEATQLTSAGMKNTATGFAIVRFDDKAIAYAKGQKAVKGKDFLASIGVSIEESKDQNVSLYYKGGKIIPTNPNEYKVFSLTVDKKSSAGKTGMKTGDLLIIHGDTKNKLQGTTKIFFDSKEIDLSNYGNKATLNEIYSVFGDAESASKIVVQIRRKSTGCYDLKEIVLKK